MVTLAPTMSSFTTSSALWTPPVAARLSLYAPEKNSDPGQRQAKSLRRAQQDIRTDFQFFQINIGLVEAIEENQRVCAGFVQTMGHVRQVAEERAELDRHWNRDRGLHRPQNIEIGFFNVCRGLASDRSGCSRYCTR